MLLDVTFFGRGYGVLLCRDAHRKNHPHYPEVTTETTAEYAIAKADLAAKGIRLLAVVIDGRRGVKQWFSDLPVQFCQFHQIKIITRYLTTRPKLQAAQELRTIAMRLTQLTEKECTDLLACWYEKWCEFLKEKTINPENKKKWTYTHRRLRSAYFSLKRNLPNLFTYQKYPELNIPNTTNSIDGFFSGLKERLSVHRGMSKKKRYQLIQEILA